MLTQIAQEHQEYLFFKLSLHIIFVLVNKKHAARFSEKQ